MNEYLTEQRLGLVLEQLFPQNTFIHDKTVPNSETRRRPDYRCDELMLIIEFDGDKHYKEVAKIKNEQQKDRTYSEMGYRVVRIPYFVQISTNTIQYFFEMNYTWEQTYSHGFISENVVMPCDYCELGIQKFINDLNRFDFIRHDIIQSLRNKIEIFRDNELVLPNSIEYICNI
jgi:hypothetical protein